MDENSPLFPGFPDGTRGIPIRRVRRAALWVFVFVSPLK
jgi:hypothetical protein